jgi:hypothetical protein
VWHDLHAERLIGSVELGPHHLAIVDLYIRCVIHLELVDVERVLAVFEEVRAMVGVHQPLGLHLDADLFAELARGRRPAILTRPDVSPGQGELRPVGVLHE